MCVYLIHHLSFQNRHTLTLYVCLETDRDGNASRQLLTSAAFQCAPQHFSSLRTRHTIVFSGNGFSIDVMTHAWERKLIFTSVNFCLQCGWKIQESDGVNTIDLYWTQEKQNTISTKGVQYLMQILK